MASKTNSVKRSSKNRWTRNLSKRLSHLIIHRHRARIRCNFPGLSLGAGSVPKFGLLMGFRPPFPLFRGGIPLLRRQRWDSQIPVRSLKSVGTHGGLLLWRCRLLLLTPMTNVPVPAGRGRSRPLTGVDICKWRRCPRYRLYRSGSSWAKAQDAFSSVVFGGDAKVRREGKTGAGCGVVRRRVGAWRSSWCWLGVDDDFGVGRSLKIFGIVWLRVLAFAVVLDPLDWRHCWLLVPWVLVKRKWSWCLESSSSRKVGY